MCFDDIILFTSAKSFCLQEYHHNTGNEAVSRKGRSL